MKIVCYEGSRRNAVCNWGAAGCIVDNGSLFNAVFPGLNKTNDLKNDGYKELASFVRKGSVEKLEIEIETDGLWKLDKNDKGNHPMFVFDMPAEFFDREPYNIHSKSVADMYGVITSGKGNTRGYIVFKDHKSLQQWLYHLHCGKHILVPYKDV